MFLSSALIRAECDKGLISPATFKPENVKQASYDLRLGSESYVVGNDVPALLTTDKQRYLTIAPGQFALLTTAEELVMPDYLLAFITLRNSFKMQGLINVSGFHVDPTHKGILVFAVNNIGPSEIRLRLFEATFTIFFSQVQGEVEGVRLPVGNELPLQYIQLLGGSSITLAKLQKELEDLKTKMLIYAPLCIALLIALLVNFLRNSH